MEITTRSFFTLLHGMCFGALYLLACSGALLELYRFLNPALPTPPTTSQQRFLQLYLIVMTILAWAAVLTGAYLVYPWYRAVPPPGTTNLSLFPQRLLLSNATTGGWHSLGMEWKEHIAWFTPISITMVTAIVLRYGADLRLHRRLRTAVLTFTAASFLSAAVAGFFGAMINKYAPIQGGPTIHIAGGER